MAEDGAQAGEEEGGGRKGRLRPLVIGAGLMVLTGGAAFGAAQMGLIPGLGGGEPEAAAAAPAAATPYGEDAAPALDVTDLAFVPAPPITVSLGSGAGRLHLVFAAQIEVPPEKAETVEALMPRITDVLGGYLRALEPADVEAPGAHVRLRAQMLRRVRLVAGSDAVRDLLVTDFVVN